MSSLSFHINSFYCSTTTTTSKMIHCWMFTQTLSQHLWWSCWQSLFLPVYLWWQFCVCIVPHMCAPSTLVLATHLNKQQSTVKLTAAWWLSLWRLALVSTWTWKNYQLELSVSPQLPCFYCSGKLCGCCQAAWLLATAPPLAMSQSAPSSSVCIVSG